MSEAAEYLRSAAQCLSQMASQAPAIEGLAQAVVKALQGGKKVLVVGNGGSAADAQHLAAELVGRFEKERQPLPALALTTNSSTLTAVANDFGYDHVFERQVQALVNPGDVLIAISTSGQSRSVLAAVSEAKRRGAWTSGWTAQPGGRLKELVDLWIGAPSARTSHAQECHAAVIHALCARLDAAFSSANA